MTVAQAEGSAADTGVVAGEAEEDTTSDILILDDDQAAATGLMQPDAGDDGSESQGESQPQAEADWAAVFREHPERWTNIPSKQRTAAFRAGIEMAVEEVQEAARQALPFAYTRGYEEGREAAKWDLTYEELKADTPYERDQRFADDPELGEKFHARLKREKAGQTEPGQSQAKNRDPRLDALRETLTENPGLEAILRREETSRGSSYSDWKDLQKAITKGLVELDGKKSTPEASAAKSRESNAAARASVPRAEVSVGAGPHQVVLTRAKLAAMTSQQIIALKSTPEGLKAHNRVLAAG